MRSMRLWSLDARMPGMSFYNDIHDHVAYCIKVEFILPRGEASVTASA